MLQTAKKKTCRIILRAHAELSESPVFLFPYLTGREQRSLAQITSDDTESVENFDHIYNLVAGHLIGWENMGIDFDAKKLMDVCNYSSVIELAARLVYQNNPPVDKPDSSEKSE